MKRSTKWAALAAAGLMTSLPVTAADFAVTNNNDAGAGSLREAINGANALMGADTITLNILLATPTITLASDLPTITDPVSIAPSGSIGTVARPTISGAGNFQIFDVDSEGTVSFSSLELLNGSAPSGGALIVRSGSTVQLSNSNLQLNFGNGGAANQGGAVDNAGTLTVTNTAFTGNQAVTGSGSGGAIISSGTLNVTGGSFAFNQAKRAGGAIEMNSATAVTTLNGVDFNGNVVDGTPANGGAIHVGSTGTTNITNCNFDSNTAGEGGGVWNGGGLMTIVGGSFSQNISTSTDPTNGPAGDDGGATGNGNARGGGAIFGRVAGGTIDISGGTMIIGNTAGGDVGSGGGIFVNEGHSLIANGITIGSGIRGGGNQANRAGGGIEMRSGSTVTLTNVTIEGNIANTTAGGGGGNGGGVHMTGMGSFSMTGSNVITNAAVEGGGLWNGSGTMTIVGGSISGNSVSGGAADAGDNNAQGGGGIFANNAGGTVDISGGTLISGNSAGGSVSSGGGIFMNEGSILSATGITISGNDANRAGGGIEQRAGSSATLTDVTIDGNVANTTGGGGGGNGGGIHITGAGDVTLNSVIVSNNTAQEGGGLWNGSGMMSIVGGSITGNEAIGGTADPGDNSAQGGGGIFGQIPGGVVSLTGGTVISGNNASGAVSSGGGIFMNEMTTLIASDIMINGNTANRAGGGIEVRANTSTTLTNVTMDGNTANTTLGGGGGNGGALHQTGAGSTTTIDRSSVSNNTAANEGGGLWSFNDSVLNLYNSTVHGNEAQSANGGGGGGLFIRPASTANLINATLASNTATADGGGVQLADGTSTLNAGNTLIADNSSAASGNDVSGSVSGNNNLVESLAGASLSGTNNVTGTDPNLGPLQDNGGTTLTTVPGAGSVAIDAGDNATCASMQINNVDQRGFGRPLDGDDSGVATCDIGAVEVQVQPIVIVTANGDSGSGATLSVDAGSQNVAALAFSLSNNSGEAVTVNGLAGTLSGSGDFGADVQARLVLDANGNGQVDAGENTVPANVVINSMGKGAGGSFSVSFTPAIVLANGGTQSYVLAVNFSADLAMASLQLKLLSGGTLSLIGLAGLAGLGAMRGRRRWLTVAVVLTVAGLSGCGGGNGNGNANGVFGQTETFQFRMNAIDGQGNTSGQSILLGAPVDGPTITAVER